MFVDNETFQDIAHAVGWTNEEGQFEIPEDMVETYLEYEMGCGEKEIQVFVSQMKKVVKGVWL